MQYQLFNKIIAKEIPADIIYEDEQVIAFKDINPVQEGHFLVVPKTYSKNLIDIQNEHLTYLMLKSRELALREITKLGVTGFQLRVNNGEAAGQEVFHTHIHIIPSKKGK